jgi:PGF-pre-PGF domain-containing protein
VTDHDDGDVPRSLESSDDELESSGGGAFFYDSFGIIIANCRFDNLDNIRAERESEEPEFRESDIIESFSAILNTSRTPGTNIAGGPYLGGNLWLNDPAQNISEWCADADFDGICDEPLLIAMNDGEEFGTDHLPLVYGGTVAIASTPAGAYIHLDGVNITRTTDTSLSLPVGDYTITVTLADYVTPENRTVTVSPGETVPVVFDLEEVCGILNVSSVPAGARIVLDGVDTGRLTNATLEDILPGEHNVTVVLAGYKTPENRTVTVSPDETTEVAFALEALPTPTPTSSSSGSSGRHSDLAADSTGKIPAGGSGTLAFRGPAIYEIRVTVGESIQTLLVTIGRSGIPSGVEAPAGLVFEYDEVTIYHTTDDAIEGALILFSIPKAWLAENSIDPADVVLYRYHDGAWQALPTEVTGEDETSWHFSAQSPGFSLFAIGGEPAPVAVKVPDVGAQAGTTEPLPPVTETPASPPAETPQPFPTMILLLCGAAVLLIAAVVLWKRR